MAILTTIKNEPGIYEIHNTISGKRYIGQSVHVRTRLLKHINLLNKNKHLNKHLQSSWNYYGEDKFPEEVQGISAADPYIHPARVPHAEEFEVQL